MRSRRISALFAAAAAAAVLSTGCSHDEPLELDKISHADGEYCKGRSYERDEKGVMKEGYVFHNWTGICY